MTIIAGYGILAHSRPDKIGAPRFLPLYIRRFSMDYQSTTHRAKNPLKYHSLLLQNLEMLPLFKKRLTMINHIW